ncbi:MAG: hypothetical protein U9O18_01820, partial [Chloroflexota bacterium]|nr:hypothetical protein [Chloroflexota bacterium]
YLYGPCTGLGLMEVEKPWMEAVSEYTIEPGMTFQADTFFYDDDFGCRWENGMIVTEDGPAEMLSSGTHMDLIEIDC